MNATARIICLVLLTASGMAGSALAQEVTLTFAPERTTVSFTLDDVLHTVHGSFSLKSGVVHFNPSTDAISGNIIVGAMSGNSGSVGRDRKMHKEVLDSSSYPEVTFQPDHLTTCKGQSRLRAPLPWKSMDCSAFTVGSMRSWYPHAWNWRTTIGI